ncbi:MAG TPA: alpha/beta hydrolase [Flavobacterium sp.]|jgi:proline iminopeptidase
MVVKVKNKDTVLYTEIYENSSKETVILLHGGPGGPEDFTPIINRLKKRYQIIYFHQRGTKNSPSASHNFEIESYIADIDSIADHFNIRQFHVFGHSWGGLYAGIYADKRTDRILSLFLCSPASGTGKQWLEMSLEVGKYNKRKSTLTEWLGMMKDSFLGSLKIDNACKKFHRQFIINCNKGHKVEPTAPALLECVKAPGVNGLVKAVSVYEELKQLHPEFNITVTYGDDDIYGESQKYVRERYPSAKFVQVPNCGHMHWLHNPKVFFEQFDSHFGIREQ